MKLEIDQSGKVEYTSHDTVLAFSNGKQGSIFLPAKDKKILLNDICNYLQTSRVKIKD
ncbi:MAG: hypothetical protein GF390_03080 [Candidatus Pacebacteria bacterium]|nr:hypothetical protein [Candidatus Paceibacterota bacterium]